MDYRVEFSRQAREDLREIAAYIRADAIEQAAYWFDGLSRAIHSLETLPERGTRLREHARYRQILYGSRPHVYRIIYRVVKRTRRVVIAHVRHGARLGDGL